MESGKRKKYSLIIFDWDGTLADTVAIIVESLKKAAVQLDIPVLEDGAYKDVIGLSLKNAVLQLYPDLEEELVKQYQEAYIDAYIQLEVGPPRFFSGVTAGLESLNKAGIQLAVATGKQRADLERSIAAKGYGNFFNILRTADDAESKPHPMMLVQILEELQVEAEEALMVGDSGFDLAMAANAGMDSVGVSYGAQNKLCLERHGPLCIVDSFDEFMEWLGQR